MCDCKCKRKNRGDEKPWYENPIFNRPAICPCCKKVGFTGLLKGDMHPVEVLERYGSHDHEYRAWVHTDCFKKLKGKPPYRV